MLTANTPGWEGENVGTCEVEGECKGSAREATARAKVNGERGTAGAKSRQTAVLRC